MTDVWCKYPDNSAYWAGSSTPPDVQYLEAVSPGMYEVVLNREMVVGLQSSVPVSDQLYEVETPERTLVCAMIRTFLAAGELYKQYGMVHKRGVLLHGPPGAGKTCLMAIIAQQCVREHNAVVLHSSPVQLAGVAAAQIRKRQTSPIVVLVEDIDRFAESSELTQMLDGAKQVDGVVFLATTNYLDRIPPRVRCRPSRFDTVIAIEGAPPDAAMQYLRDATGAPDEELRPIVEAGMGLPFAHLKELFLATKVFGLSLHAVAEQLRRSASVKEEVSYV